MRRAFWSAGVTSNPIEDDSNWTVIGPTWSFTREHYQLMQERQQKLMEMLDQIHDHVGEEVADDLLADL